MEIKFPNKASIKLSPNRAQAYYITHYQHVLNYLYNIGNVSIIPDDTTINDPKHNNNFMVKIDNKKIVFDYSDFDYNTLDFKLINDDIKYFKIHTTELSNKRCLPFPPMSFMDWDEYDKLSNEVKYNPVGSLFYKCRIYGAATHRRTTIKEILQKYNGLQCEYDFVEQPEYFKSFNNCRMNIIVPGARNDMLDRTHLQSFALGIPVITPKLTTLLPFYKKFEPNIDYIECKHDYSDLIELIEKYKNDKKYLDFISNNCKNKFRETCTPMAVKEWIEKIL